MRSSERRYWPIATAEPSVKSDLMIICQDCSPDWKDPTWPGASAARLMLKKDGIFQSKVVEICLNMTQKSKGQQRVSVWRRCITDVEQGPVVTKIRECHAV